MHFLAPAELDRFAQHAGSFPAVQRILGGHHDASGRGAGASAAAGCGARFAELTLRECPSGAAPHPMQFHHDRALPSRLHRAAGAPVDDVCAIHYLSDVTPRTPAFCIVPGSGRCASLAEAREALGAAYVEQPLYGRAGTCVLYDIATWHTRLNAQEAGELGSPAPVPDRRLEGAGGAAVSGGGSGGRRTMHQYYSRGGWLGSRPPAPPLTEWQLIPRRLALHPCPATRRFFSLWNAGQCEWAAGGFLLRGRARHPRAVGAAFRGFDSRREMDAFFAADEDGRTEGRMKLDGDGVGN